MARKNRDPQTKEVTTFGSATVAYVNFGLLIGANGLGIYFTDKENRQQSALDQHYVRTYGHLTHLDKLRDEFNTSELSAAGYEPLWADDDNFINVYRRQELAARILGKAINNALEETGGDPQLASAGGPAVAALQVHVDHLVLLVKEGTRLSRGRLLEYQE